MLMGICTDVHGDALLRELCADSMMDGDSHYSAVLQRKSVGRFPITPVPGNKISFYSCTTGTNLQRKERAHL